MRCQWAAWAWRVKMENEWWRGGRGSVTGTGMLHH